MSEPIQRHYHSDRGAAYLRDRVEQLRNAWEELSVEVEILRRDIAAKEKDRRRYARLVVSLQRELDRLTERGGQDENSIDL